MPLFCLKKEGMKVTSDDKVSRREAESFSSDFNEILRRTEKKIIGQKEIIRDILASAVSGGNVLLEGMPGLGKTKMIKTISEALSLEFSRIQFTPDLMPSDITGTDIFFKKADGEGSFKFQKGPVFSNIVLADEINRATPKTQSALLEAMQEKTVTSGGNTYSLPSPFFVLATQNPVELEGTYPLPEAQLDRFMVKLNVKFPDAEELAGIVLMEEENEELTPVFGSDKLMRMNKTAKSVPISESVLKYAMRLVLGTHPEISETADIIKKYVSFGSSPRGAQAIVALGRVYALLDGRFNVSFTDIEKAAYPTLRHRIYLNFDALSEDITSDYIIERLLEETEK